MANILIVTAHPSSWGFTHKIAATYKTAKEGEGDTVFTMDLYKKKYAQPFLCFEDIKKDCPTTPAHKAIQEKILWASEIIFVFPVWWFGPPAILKNFLDQNFTSGFAYKYETGGIRRELLEGRTARIFSTADGPRSLYFLFRWTAYLRWSVGVLGFCGIRLRSFDVFANMIHRRDDKSREQMLARVRERAHAHHM
ncbi:MAG: NAD(P)H-dependent oxidoreductase [bacterium]|nr:NAD(P)H-dependent oxidoreductase [bacterium]